MYKNKKFIFYNLFLVVLFLILTLLNISFLDNFNNFKGINLAGYFQFFNLNTFNFDYINFEDFKNLRNIGFNLIRFPVDFENITIYYNNNFFKIDERFFFFFDIILNYCQRLNFKIILDNHYYHEIRTDPAIKYKLLKWWEQISKYYKNKYEDILFFEILNEPFNIDENLWYNIQKEVVELIRGIDKDRIIVVSPANYNSFNELENIFDYGENIIYDFHFYEPFLFTHQGANWVTPSMVDVKYIPFPFNENYILSLPESLKNTWIESLYYNYKNDSNLLYLEDIIKKIKEISLKRKINILCGEFGVYMKNCKYEDRIFWHKFVRSTFDKYNISWVLWNYIGGMGIFNDQDDYYQHLNFNNNVNKDLLNALGLNIENSKTIFREENEKGQNFSEILIYDDYFHNRVIDYSWLDKKNLNLYSSKKVFEGKFSIEIKNIKKWSGLYLKFLKNLNFEIFKECYIKFYLYSNSKFKIEVRFINIENDYSIPWRLSYEVEYKNKNSWQEFIIPINQMYESGAYISNLNIWIPPEKNKFDFNKIEFLAFIAEFYDLKNEIFIDNIKIIKNEK